MKERPKRFLILAAAAVAAVVLALLGIPYVSAFFKLSLAAGVLVAVLWLLWKAYHAFLWKVGRRLAFSYFLIGVLPIPIMLLLMGVLAYLLSGFFLGHLYRDAVGELQSELQVLARARVEAFAVTGEPRRAGAPGVAFAYYKNGKRISGDPQTPKLWPAWTETEKSPGEKPAERNGREQMTRFIARPDGVPTLAAFAARDGHGVAAFYAGDVDLEISRRSELWVETYRSDDPDLKVISLEMSGRKIPLQRLRKDQQAVEAAKFFKELSEGERFWDSPLLWWGEISGPLLDPQTGKELSSYVATNLNGTPRTVLRHLFASAAEIDTFAWITLFVVSFLLFDVYAAAALMALFMIVGLSRAVNRLSWGTTAVREGDFSVRIPVRRRDQVGDLQRSFNEMAANLETLVAATAQKELLEKELELARSLQQSLLPGDLPAGDGIEFATLFEPSAAIGGDYFDVLRTSERELAVIIADVSGHGLSTGLRMAMLKAALLILIEETREPEEILRRLDAVVRDRKSRVFVTATLSFLDVESGVLRLTNAGHPPTYRLHGGEVDEILLPSSPLGGLGHTYGRAELQLERGDVVVWLSDGLIEASNAADEPFGYERVIKALAGGIEGETAADVRDRLLHAIATWVGGQPLGDDRTLVVMRYKTRETRG